MTMPQQFVTALPILGNLAYKIKLIKLKVIKEI